MIWYVNNAGPINSANACPQPGKCERELDDNDPELREFLNRNLVKLESQEAR